MLFRSAGGTIVKGSAVTLVTPSAKLTSKTSPTATTPAAIPSVGATTDAKSAGTSPVLADAWINDLLRLIGQKYNETYNDFQYNPDDNNVITVGKYKYNVDTTHQLLTSETFNNMFCMYLYDKNIFYTLHATTDIKKNRRDISLYFELSDALPAYIRTAHLWSTLNQILILTNQNETSKKHYYFYVEKNENNTNYYLIFDKQTQLPTWRPQAEQIANQFKSHFG